MTAKEFVVAVRKAAREQAQPVLAVDFEPQRDGGIKVIFRFKK